MANNTLLSQTISSLRFPLTVGVVFIHFNLLEGLSMPGVVYGLDYPDWYFYFIQFFSNVLPRIAVPLFFFISGFLFFYNVEFNGNTYKLKLHTRAKTLLIPFLLWNGIALFQKSARVLPFLSSLATPAEGVEFHFSLIRLFNTFFNYTNYNGILVVPVEEEIVDFASYPIDVPMNIMNSSLFMRVDFASYPIDGPMWYVRDLMVMVLMAPAIYWMIKGMGKWAVISIGVVKYCIIPTFFPNCGYPSQFITAMFFFSWGAYFSVSKENFIETMRKYKYVPFVYFLVAIVDTLTKRSDYNFYFHNLGILLGIVSAIIIASYLVEKRKVVVNPTLANASFFVYAFHKILLNPIGRAAVLVLHLPDKTYVRLVLYVAVPIITVGLCLGVYGLLKKYAPIICNLLTGGR